MWLVHDHSLVPALCVLQNCDFGLGSRVPPKFERPRCLKTERGCPIPSILYGVALYYLQSHTSMAPLGLPKCAQGAQLYEDRLCSCKSEVVGKDAIN